MQLTNEARRLLKKGYSVEDVWMGQECQTGQKNMGMTPQSIEDILAGKPPAKRRATGENVVPASFRQYRERGVVGQALVSLTQAAEVEDDPEVRAIMVRAVNEIRSKTKAPAPSPFRRAFFKGNVSMSDGFIETLMERLRPLPHSNEALWVLLGLIKFVGKEDPEVKLARQADLADLIGMKAPSVSRALNTLEAAGMIYRVKEGRRSRIFLDPEGIYRGPMQEQAMTRHKFEELKNG
jgi:DNA-binding transcriptional ArsR family regulator